MNKLVRNRVEKKRFNVRNEHVRPSKCRSDFLTRAKAVDAKLREAKAKGIRLPIEEIKRFPTAPKSSYVVVADNVITLKPIAYDDMM